MKSVYRLIQSTIASHGAGVGIGAELIAQQCAPGADVNAVFFRAALLQYLFQSGHLNEWSEKNEPAAVVFHAAATFPMEQGIQGFDPAKFIAWLRPGEA